MNCEKAEQLIPLFVEADLDAAEMQQVSHHLETCPACRDLAAEFQASQASLHTAASPVFDEAVFAEMRTAVQHAVVRTATRPALAELLNPIWNWKFGFAAAAALLLLISGVVMRSQVDVGKKNQVVSKEQQQSDDSKLAETLPNAEVKNQWERPAFNQPRMGRRHKAQGEVSVSERNAGTSVGKHLSPERAIDTDRQIVATSAVPAGANDSLPVISGVDALGFILPLTSPVNDGLLAQGQENSTKPATTSEPEMLRMEIQTADPNIKIIWLTPKEPATAHNNPAADTR